MSARALTAQSCMLFVEVESACRLRLGISEQIREKHWSAITETKDHCASPYFYRCAKQHRSMLRIQVIYCS